MKTQIQSKILAIATAAMIGLATTSGAALARGGGGFGGGFGGGHIGGFGVSHMGGLGVHPMGMPGIAMDRGLDDHGLGHTHVSHEWGHHHFRGLYGMSPRYDNNNCPGRLT